MRVALQVLCLIGLLGLGFYSAGLTDLAYYQTFLGTPIIAWIRVGPFLFGFCLLMLSEVVK